MNTLTRAAGYRRSRGKGEAGEAFAQAFLRWLGVDTAPIEGFENNYYTGDLAYSDTGSIEVKNQPIDPTVYPKNYMELFEYTGKPHHSELSEIMPLFGLGLDYFDHRGQRFQPATLDPEWRVSDSTTSIRGSTLTMYVNPDKGFVYLYNSNQMVGLGAEGVRRMGLHRALGKSNQDGFGTRIDLPKVIWRYRDGVGQAWGKELSPDHLAAYRQGYGQKILGLAS